MTLAPLRPAIALCLAALACACSSSAPPSISQARAHLEMLAETIGTRPTGTSANQRARDYLVRELERLGFDVRIQEADAVRPERGQTTHVFNIIATRAGSQSDAIGLVSHYDSSPFAPGAADDALGVAVCLEAARVLAARGDMRHTLMVLVTDGEEAGLMGAVALVTDPEVSSRLRAYVNLEALGPSGPAVLFETGDGWLVDAWRRAAPWPRGTSYATEIYQRLPNDTDFTILNRHGIRGLNFATTGSSAVYHTSRDTADRIPTRFLQQSVDNTVAVVQELDRGTLTTAPTGERVFFDVLHVVAFSYGMTTSRALTIIALLLAVVVWIRLTVAARRRSGFLTLLITAVWSVLMALCLVALLLGLTLALRMIHGTYHPSYAHPDRLLALFTVAMGAGLWVLMRCGHRLPARIRGSNDPRVVWIVALPVWALLTAAMELAAPAASYLWALPLLCSAALLLVTPRESKRLLRMTSVVILTIVAAFWVRDTIVLHGFIGEQMARLPGRPPALVYILLPTVAGVMLVPPFVASFAGWSSFAGFRRAIARLLLVAAAVIAIITFTAPTYSFDRPLRRTIRYVHDGASGTAVWEVGSLEAGLEIEPADDDPRDWRPVDAAFLATFPVGVPRMPFLYRSVADSKPFPGSVQIEATPEGGDVAVRLSVVAPQGSEVRFVLPAAVPVSTPTLAGTLVRGHWVASYEPAPATGVTLRFRLQRADLDRLDDAAVMVEAGRLDEGPGWQGLPRWLPQDRAAWAATAVFVQPIAWAIQQAASAETPPQAQPSLR